MGKEVYFQNALSNFIDDFAGGGAIRHLADQNLTVREIRQRLDYPMSEEKIGKIVWQHYLTIGRILLEEPPQSGFIEKVTFKKEQGKYGRTTMVKVVERQELPGTRYLLCDFGKRLYQSPEKLREQIAVLDQRQQDYLLGLPWPLQPVYHVEDEWMREIGRVLGM